MAENFIHGDLGVVSVIQETDINQAPTVWDVNNTVIEVREWSVKPTIAQVEKKRFGKTHKAPGSASGKRMCEIEFEVALPGMAVADVGTPVLPPDFAALMMASGWTYTSSVAGTGTKAVGSFVFTNDAGAAVQTTDTVTIGVTAITAQTGGFDGINAATSATALAAYINATPSLLVTATAVGDTVNLEAITGGAGGNAIATSATTTEGVISPAAATLLGGVTAATDTVLFMPATLKCLGAPEGQMTGQSTCSIRLFAFKDGACVGAATNSGVYMVEAHGVKLNASLTITSEDESVFKFSGRGFYARPIETDIDISPNFRATDDSLVAQSGTVRVDGANEFVSNFEFDMGFEVKERPSIGGIGGLGGFVLSRTGTPGGSFDSEASMDDVSPGGLWDKVESGERTDVFIRVTSAQGVHVSVHVPNAQFESPEPTMDGVMKYSKPYKARDNTSDGDDYIGIRFTTVLAIADSPIFV